MGRIIKTVAGTFQVSVNDIYGNRIRKTFDQKKDANAFISKIESPKHQFKLEKNNLRQRRITFDTAVTDFLNSKTNLSPKSITKYNFAMKQLKLFLVALKITFLDEFTPDHATILHTELMKEQTDASGNKSTASPKTINQFISTIKALFQDEVNKSHIVRNPFAHIKSLKQLTARPEYYTVNELNAFFNVEMKNEYRNAFLGFLYTGMRFGELANITWSDIDFENKLIFVRPKADHALKTSNAERNIPMTEKLFDLLSNISKNKKSDIYPFCSVEGKQLRERRLLEVAKAIGEKAGITSRVFIHKFRHTYATLLIQKKTPLEKVQQLLGHSSIVESMIYVHIKSEELHPDVNVLNDILADNSPSNNSPTNIFRLNTHAA